MHRGGGIGKGGGPLSYAPPVIPGALVFVFALCCAALLAARRWGVAVRRGALRRRFEGAGLRRRVVLVPGGELSCWVGPRGRPPLLLVHGLGGSALWQWGELVAPLSCSFQLIVPDLPGFGSSKLTDLGLDSQAAALRDLLAALEIDVLRGVVGSSYGGAVTWRLASRSPELFERLVLLGSPGPVYTQADARELLDRYGVRSAGELLLPTDPKALERLMQATLRRRPALLPLLYRGLLRELFDHRRHEKERLVEGFVGQAATLAEDPLPPMPTLILWGSEDPLLPPTLGERLRDHCGGELVLVEGARHAPSLDPGSPVSGVLLRWLRAPR